MPAAQPPFRLAHGPLDLLVHRWGDHPRPAVTLVALHGFTGDGADFGILATRCPDDWVILAPDLPGHGQTRGEENPAAWSVDLLADLVVRLLDLHPSARRALLGYSMGGRLALQVAVIRPRVLDGLALVGASPGLADPVEREARRQQDEAHVRVLRDQGLEAFLRDWQAQPLLAGQSRLPSPWRESLQQRRRRHRPEALALSLRHWGTGVLPSRWDRLAELSVPTLLVTGAEDAKFQQLAGRMATLLPAARHCSIPHAGHTAHLEQPDLFTRELERFFREIPAGGVGGDVSRCPP